MEIGNAIRSPHTKSPRNPSGSLAGGDSPNALEARYLLEYPYEPAW